MASLLASTSRTLFRTCDRCGQSIVAAPARRRLHASSRRWASSDPARPAVPPAGGPKSAPGEASPELPTYGKPATTTFSWMTVALFVAAGGGLWYYFDAEKKRVTAKAEKLRATRSVGKADIGGPFNMITMDGKPFTERDLLGQFHLVYFGFTNCPDICPEELDKMGYVVDAIAAKHGQQSIRPVFVSVDPGRDTAKAMKTYLRDFHPSTVGLVGEYDEVKQMCKKYRVYFSTPPNTKPGEDYLVDHSIFFYLMSTEGHFVDAFGKVFTKEEVVSKTLDYISEYKDGTRWGGVEDIVHRE